MVSGLIGALVVLVIILLMGLRSFHAIGPSQVGLVGKRLGKKLHDGQLIAQKHEAGYQAALLMPGLRFKFWPLFKVERYPWVQVPPDHIGIVIAQVGAPLPTGAKSAVYRNEFGSFDDLGTFLQMGGQRGVQRPVLPPGTIAPIHPVGFVVITSDQIFGRPISDSTMASAMQVDQGALRVAHITPQGDRDVVGVVTTLEGPPSGDIASRIGAFSDVTAMEEQGTGSAVQVIQAVLKAKNDLHDNYQDYQAFLDNGGCIGLQHDPILYGSYLLNPFLVKVELREMLVVRQGEVAVIKSYVGLPTEDTSGEEFKFGSIVKPGHQGIWSEPLRTGKYTLNPRIYEAEIVPTSILTLNWSHATSDAHSLDERLAPIEAKSKEAFTFSIDLQVQIHVPDTRAPKVISMVGTMQNLVNEVLQSAVGNYFRNKLQTLGATEFIEKRDEVQSAAEGYIQQYLSRYEVKTRGVYIQDVVFPADLVAVLTSREIAAQERATFAQQRSAQEARVSLEQQRGVADMQAQLAEANVSIDIEKSRAAAARARAEGEAAVITQLGSAEASRTRDVGNANAAAEEALGLARAKGFDAQRKAIGSEQTALVAALREVGTGQVKIVPDIQVGSDSGGIIGGLGAMLMRSLADNDVPSAHGSGGDGGSAPMGGNGSGSGGAEPSVARAADVTIDAVVVEPSGDEPAGGAPVGDPAVGATDTGVFDVDPELPVDPSDGPAPPASF